MKKIVLEIAGMHCVSCELLLERELKKLEGMHRCKISHVKGEARIVCDNGVEMKRLEECVESCGYKLAVEHEKHEGKRNAWADYLVMFEIAVVLVVLLYILSELEVTRFFPELGADVGIAIALVFGLVASVSTCLALVGGIVMSFASSYPIHEDKQHKFLSRAMPHIYFHIGRIGGFVLLGGVLGLIGAKVNFSLTFTGYLTIFIAILMFYIGLQTLNIVPNITKLGFHLPKFLGRGALKKTEHKLAPIIIGALTFFLPCGFTQAMQLTAVNSQSFWMGGLIMGAFALGTLPVLLSVGIGSTYAKKEKSGMLVKVMGVIILFFALYSLNSGFILSGSSFTLDFWKNQGDASVSEVSDDLQVIKMDVDWGFEPTEFKLKKGVPVRMEINGINVSGCSNEIVIPKLGISKKIEIGLNVLEFTPEESGVLPFSCWMGMIGGRFIVE